MKETIEDGHAKKTKTTFYKQSMFRFSLSHDTVLQAYEELKRV
jgi:hypothetical protein